MFGDGSTYPYQVNDIDYDSGTDTLVVGGYGYDDALGVSNKGFLALYTGELNRILWRKHFT